MIDPDDELDDEGPILVVRDLDLVPAHCLCPVRRNPVLRAGPGIGPHVDLEPLDPGSRPSRSFFEFEKHGRLLRDPRLPRRVGLDLLPVWNGTKAKWRLVAMQEPALQEHVASEPG